MAVSWEHCTVVVRGVVVEDGADRGVDDQRQREHDDQGKPREEGEGGEAADATEEVALDHRAKDECARHGDCHGRDRLIINDLGQLLLVEDGHAKVVELLAHHALGPRHAEARAGRRLARDEHNDSEDEQVDRAVHHRAVLALGVHHLQRVLDALRVQAPLRLVAVADLAVDVATDPRRRDWQQDEHEELHEERRQVVPGRVPIGLPATVRALPQAQRDGGVVGRALLADGPRRVRVHEAPWPSNEDAVEDHGDEKCQRAVRQPLASRRLGGGGDHERVADEGEARGRELL